MALNDKGYFEQRAEAELHLAQGAVHPAAVRAHVAMAEAYLQRMNDDPLLHSRSSIVW